MHLLQKEDAGFYARVTLYSVAIFTNFLFVLSVRFYIKYNIMALSSPLRKGLVMSS